MRLATYNLQGLNLGCPLFETLLNNNDGVAKHKHLLRDFNIGLLQEIINNFDVFATAMNESEYQYGRFFRGTALLWLKDVLLNVNTYSIAVR